VFRENSINKRESTESPMGEKKIPVNPPGRPGIFTERGPCEPR
jgi:hypothetical protein